MKNRLKYSCNIPGFAMQTVLLLWLLDELTGRSLVTPSKHLEFVAFMQLSVIRVHIHVPVTLSRLSRLSRLWNNMSWIQAQFASSYWSDYTMNLELHQLLGETCENFPRQTKNTIFAKICLLISCQSTMYTSNERYQWDMSKLSFSWN